MKTKITYYKIIIVCIVFFNLNQAMANHNPLINKDKIERQVKLHQPQKNKTKYSLFFKDLETNKIFFQPTKIQKILDATLIRAHSEYIPKPRVGMA